jgi:hypothetical protein
MVGDLPDFVSRLGAVLPKRWFAERSPNLTTLLTAIATPWVWFYDLFNYVRNQTRLMTATDGFLDLISYDYFGLNLARKAGESDNLYRGRIQTALQQEAATRSALAAGLDILTGNQPFIFEPGRCADTGSYGTSTVGAALPSTGMAYCKAGGWGSLLLPYQCFVTVTRPATSGIGMVTGYNTPNGGYGEGALSYIDLSLLTGQVSDADIQLVLSRLLPVNTVAWLKIV